MAIGPTSADPATTKKDAPPGGLDLVLKVAGAVGTGIGILGFVTFFGGAVLWLRAEQADLPANEAISVIPKNLLLVTGASFLVPAVLIALGAISTVFAVRLVLPLWRRHQYKDLFKAERKSRDDAERLALECEAQEREVREQGEEEAAVNAKLERAEATGQPTTGLAVEARERIAATAKAKEKEVELRVTASAAQAVARKAEATTRLVTKRTHKQFLAELTLAGLILFFAPVIGNGAIGHVGPGWAIVLIIIALVAVGADLATYAFVKGFVWFGVVAFITVGIYTGAATYISTQKNPKVEPAAALRGERPPVVGTFVADTTGNLYLGSFPEGAEASRLVVVPRAQVTDLAIGPLTDPGRAPAAAVRLALRQCAQVIKKPATEKAPAVAEPACSAEETMALQAQLGR